MHFCMSVLTSSAWEVEQKTCLKLDLLQDMIRHEGPKWCSALLLRDPQPSSCPEHRHLPSPELVWSSQVSVHLPALTCGNFIFCTCARLWEFVTSYHTLHRFFNTYMTLHDSSSLWVLLEEFGLLYFLGLVSHLYPSDSVLQISGEFSGPGIGLYWG